MDYLRPGSEFLPQDYSTWPMPQPPYLEHPAIERSSTSYSQWSPLPSHNQPRYLSSTVVQAYGNTTALYSNGLTAGQTSLSLNPNANNMAAQSQQLPISDSTSNTDVQPMAPPPNPRKRKAPTLCVDDWEPVKARVIELHITNKLPLPEVKEIVEEEFKSIGFTAT